MANRRKFGGGVENTGVPDGVPFPLDLLTSSNPIHVPISVPWEELVAGHVARELGVEGDGGWEGLVVARPDEAAAVWLILDVSSSLSTLPSSSVLFGRLWAAAVSVVQALSSGDLVRVHVWAQGGGASELRPLLVDRVLGGVTSSDPRPDLLLLSDLQSALRHLEEELAASPPSLPSSPSPSSEPWRLSTLTSRLAILHGLAAPAPLLTHEGPPVHPDGHVVLVTDGVLAPEDASALTLPPALRLSLLLLAPPLVRAPLGRLADPDAAAHLAQLLGGHLLPWDTWHHLDPFSQRRFLLTRLLPPSGPPLLAYGPPSLLTAQGENLIADVRQLQPLLQHDAPYPWAGCPPPAPMFWAELPHEGPKGALDRPLAETPLLVAALLRHGLHFVTAQATGAVALLPWLPHVRLVLVLRPDRTFLRASLGLLAYYEFATLALAPPTPNAPLPLQRFHDAITQLRSLLAAPLGGLGLEWPLDLRLPARAPPSTLASWAQLVRGDPHVVVSALGPATRQIRLLIRGTQTSLLRAKWAQLVSTARAQGLLVTPLAATILRQGLGLCRVPVARSYPAVG